MDNIILGALTIIQLEFYTILFTNSHTTKNRNL